MSNETNNFKWETVLLMDINGELKKKCSICGEFVEVTKQHDHETFGFTTALHLMKTDGLKLRRTIWWENEYICIEDDCFSGVGKDFSGMVSVLDDWDILANDWQIFNEKKI